MDRTFCSDSFSGFIQLMNSSYDTLAVAPRAIAAIAELLSIGSFSITFNSPRNALRPEGEEHSVLLYGTERTGCKVHKRSYTPRDNSHFGIVIQKTDEKNWTIDETEALELVCDMMFVYFGRSRTSQLLETALYTDMMTGVLNAPGYMAKGNLIVQDGKISDYTGFYFNIKGFRYINQHYGNAVGDMVIKTYTAKLLDASAPDELISRLGGDNFVSLIRKENRDKFLSMMELLNIEVKVPDGRTVPMGITSVCGYYDVERKDVIRHMGEIMRRTSCAYNNAKYSVRKLAVRFTEQINLIALKEREISSVFGAALAAREFMVYYQPKVQISSKTLIGCEALVRWNRNGNVVSPGDFIPVLEKDNTICMLDFYVLETVCRQIKEWLDGGKEPVRVSVNFSRNHLANEQLVEQIMSVLERHSVDPRYIEIEVTETIDFNEFRIMQSFCAELRKRGVTVSIDDFGTGYSSLNLLKDLPVSVLKLDRSFLATESLNERARIVVSNIIKMAGELNMQVISEGVETPEQLKFLQSINCDLVQGFIFDRPLPLEMFEKRLVCTSYD